MKQKKDISIDILYLPALVLLVVFVVYPLLSGLHISFTNWNGYSPKYKYVGAANYLKLAKDKMFFTALKKHGDLWSGKHISSDRDRYRLCAFAPEEISGTDADPGNCLSSGDDCISDYGIYFLFYGAVQQWGFK